MADTERDPTLRALADEYWATVLDASPVYATFIGDRRFDDRLDDLSAEAERAHAERLGAIGARVAAVEVDRLGAADRVTRSLLLSDIDDTRRSAELRLTEMASDQMNGVHAGLLTLAPQIDAPDPASALALVDRHRRIGRYLDQGVERFRAGLEAGRSPVRTNIDRSLNQLDGYLASPVEADPFVTLPLKADWDGEPAWRAELRTVAEEVIRPGFARYREALAGELLPAARGDDEPGLCHLPDGEEVYTALIRMHTSTTLGPDELHAIGLEEVTQVLPDRYREIGGAALGTTDLERIFTRLRDDPALRYETGDQIMADARTALSRAQAAVGDWFGTLPETPCEIEEIPGYLAADAPAAYYFPPAGDGSRPGTYFVNTDSPGDKSRAEAESIGFHEAIPGHHLQIAIATELTDVPDFQRFSLGNTAYVEGWALYTERLADEMGLYSSDLDRLGMLTADSWRAGRLVVDTGLHAMGWTRQQAVDFLVDHTPLDPEEVAVEVDRYIGMPGQALAYKVGQRAILRLRAEAEEVLGDRFTIAGFHDAVLAHGSVTLPVLDDLVAAWIHAVATA